MTNTLYDALIAPHANNTRPFMTCDDGSTISYAGFVQRVAQLAHVLRDSGVKPGDCILVQAPKTADTIALYGATLQVGAVYLPLNTAYTQSELRYFAEDATPRLIICDQKDVARIDAAFDVPVLTIAREGNGTLAQAANAAGTVFETASRGRHSICGGARFEWNR